MPRGDGLCHAGATGFRLLLGDALSMTGNTIANSISEPVMTEGALQWVAPQGTSLDLYFKAC